MFKRICSLICVLSLLVGLFSFLGMGVQTPTPSLGNLLNAAQSLTILTDKPWMWIPAGVAVILLVISINLVGDALRDAVDPRNNA